jgi:DNA ligase-1
MGKSNQREFLQLADVYDPDKVRVGGWFLSEKLDGTRCFWDGGVSRGIDTASVPWASLIDPKTGEPKRKIKPYSTGLWSRYGNPIIAPDWFLNELPACPLDGELWAGRGNFQLCRSICGGDTPDPRFEIIKFAVFGTPPIDAVVATGTIKNPNFHAEFDEEVIAKWVKRRSRTMPPAFRLKSLDLGATFHDELLALSEELDTGNERVYLHPQIKLPEDHDEAQQAAYRHLKRVVEQGGEGVMLRSPMGQWIPKRSKQLLKLKPLLDDEGVVVGFTSGRRTTRGSKLLGKIGALVLDYRGKRLELSGLTDAEREFATSSQIEYASQNPGVDMPAGFEGSCFKVGQKVTFVYSELSNDGIPLKARYLRLREDE